MLLPKQISLTLKNITIHVTVTSPKSLFASAIFIQGKNPHLHMQKSLILCEARKTCSINLSIAKKDSALVHEWRFSNGITIFGNNPKSLKFAAGSYTLTLRTLNVETGERYEKTLRILVKKLIPKKHSSSGKKRKSSSKRQKLTIKNNLNSQENPSIPNIPITYIAMTIGGILAFAIGIIMQKRHARTKNRAPYTVDVHDS